MKVRHLKPSSMYRSYARSLTRHGWTHDTSITRLSDQAMEHLHAMNDILRTVGESPTFTFENSFRMLQTSLGAENG
ncbi:hypothetical protein [Achromobacter phage Motura]|uniref:Uncharacterized protein n=1 Tax=Achromobacter phage Motura TaxID=2591403 RepID=A0A514CT39_9CAUD|nr:hypothetical protein H1O15_gp101 [Achromobacter phage Motura]QDH83649.1 hypothetical protein [Achromobacter phage Motura]